MAASTVIKHLYDGQIKGVDGTSPTPVELVLLYTVGDFTLSGLAETQRAVVAYETRGVLHSVRHAARTYPSGSFSFMLSEYSDASTGVALDFFHKTGGYSSNASTLTTEVYAVDLVLTTEGTDLGDAADHTVTMTDCVCTFDVAEGEPNKGTLNFTCYGDVTFT